jgi:hypothetical protein
MTRPGVEAGRGTRLFRFGVERGDIGPQKGAGQRALANPSSPIGEFADSRRLHPQPSPIKGLRYSRISQPPCFSLSARLRGERAGVRWAIPERWPTTHLTAATMAPSASPRDAPTGAALKMTRNRFHGKHLVLRRVFSEVGGHVCHRFILLKIMKGTLPN